MKLFFEHMKLTTCPSTKYPISLKIKCNLWYFVKRGVQPAETYKQYNGLAMFF